ncbi:hypothetical protein [Clostridium pasteurianum]|uniref:Uncharacterized protein n=1 Tax=Clostridium pasteurianum BC1 TaxID=86416 RepID=R4K511_CLOPA|nr:hypothetical protein [Clostridium pasteurianum]AGK95614.1 hypothetical protein Clopa_0566 [Clostridium pasteurianum BC1]
MASKKVYRVKKEHIKEIPKNSNVFILNAFTCGYVFVRVKDRKEVYMISTTVTKKTMKIELIENIEIVG